MVEEKKKASGNWWWALLLALPVMYVLSIGPVARIYQEFEKGDYDILWLGDVLTSFYFPILWMIKNNEQMADLIMMYLKACGCDV